MLFIFTPEPRRPGPSRAHGPKLKLIDPSSWRRCALTTMPTLDASRAARSRRRPPNARLARQQLISYANMCLHSDRRRHSNEFKILRRTSLPSGRLTSGGTGARVAAPRQELKVAGRRESASSDIASGPAARGSDSPLPSRCLPN
jgi:hypothetical protein